MVITTIGIMIVN